MAGSKDAKPLRSRLRLARKHGRGTFIHFYEIAEVVEAMELLDAMRKAEAKPDAD